MDSNTLPPMLGQTQPVYPHLLQLLRVTSGTVAGPAGSPTLYVSFTQQGKTDNLQTRDREPCLVADVGNTGLSPGLYLGRLYNSWANLPVYECVCCAGTFISTVVNFINSTVNYNNTVVNVTNGSIVNFGTSISVSVSPGGILSKPTQLVTGRPTWTPPGSYYPLLWGAYDHIEWEWDGWVRTPGGSSSIPGGSGWVPFVSVGRSPVADTDFTCITSDRVIAYTSLSAPRVVTLPPANSLPPGFTLVVQDESGSASTVSVRRQGADQINRGSADVVVVNTAFGGGTAETNGVSQWTVRQYPSASGGTTGTNGLAVLSPDYTLTGTMANSGLTITLPVAGTYLLFAMIATSMTMALPGDVVSAQLYDATAATVVPETVGNVADLEGGTSLVIQGFIQTIYGTITPSTVINLQGKTSGLGVNTLLAASASSTTSLGYVRLS